MLLSLHIENIAVIKKIDVEFVNGFIALTGETGAGKSIILDSISLILGQKADKELIRKGESTALVSALFSVESEELKAKLDEMEISVEEDNSVLIQRTLTLDGKSSIKLNGRTVNLSVLKALAPTLVSIHGQSDTGALLDPSKHIELVDTYADLSVLLKEYREAYSELESIRHSIHDISEKENERERLKEILEYQIKDIDSLKLHDGEEEELIDKKVKIKNSEKITKNSEFVYKALRGSEKGSVAYLLDRSISALSQVAGVLPSFTDYTERLRDMLYQVEDVAEEVYAVLDGMDGDPTEALNAIESRLDKIAKCKRKYGLTIKDVLEFRDKAKLELDTLENSEELLKELIEKESNAYRKALEIAEKLHSIRVKSAEELEIKVRETLEFLDMPKVVFFAKITEEYEGEKKKLNINGSDNIEFYISANRGADAQSISKIASGGELARIMLALRSVIADKDGVSTMIFDEIDAGVSGKTARKIGIKMLELSRNTQLICVTHSAQIASLSDIHLLISKSDINGATETRVANLDFDGRVKELSRILGGINVTESQRAAALDMLKFRETN